MGTGGRRHRSVHAAQPRRAAARVADDRTRCCSHGARSRAGSSYRPAGCRRWARRVARRGRLAVIRLRWRISPVGRGVAPNVRMAGEKRRGQHEKAPKGTHSALSSRKHIRRTPVVAFNASCSRRGARGSAFVTVTSGGPASQGTFADENWNGRPATAKVPPSSKSALPSEPIPNDAPPFVWRMTGPKR